MNWVEESLISPEDKRNLNAGLINLETGESLTNNCAGCDGVCPHQSHCPSIPIGFPSRECDGPAHTNSYCAVTTSALEESPSIEISPEPSPESSP